MSSQRSYSFSRQVLVNGIRDGIPIGLGYFAVSFSLGIAARKAGLSPFQGFLASLFNNASAGEYAAFTLIAAQATYLEVAIITLIANARYLLMSCALAQKFSPSTPFFHRLIIAYDVTDELFGITIARPGILNPYYTYGAILLAAPAWAGGTACGIIAGNALPLRAVSALSVALYGMFLAIIIPPARKDRGSSGSNQLRTELCLQLSAWDFFPVRRYENHPVDRDHLRCSSNPVPGEAGCRGSRSCGKRRICTERRPRK